MVQIKIARWPFGKTANASPEYEDCRRIATEHYIPLKQVMQEAMRIYAASGIAASGIAASGIGKEQS
jgi:hypothetical protein